MSVYYAYEPEKDSDVEHHGIKGQKWGVRRFQNSDGTLTAAGKKRYYHSYGKSPRIDRSSIIQKANFFSKERYASDSTFRAEHDRAAALGLKALDKLNKRHGEKPYKFSSPEKQSDDRYEFLKSDETSHLATVSYLIDNGMKAKEVMSLIKEGRKTDPNEAEKELGNRGADFIFRTQFGKIDDISKFAKTCEDIKKSEAKEEKRQKKYDSGYKSEGRWVDKERERFYKYRLNEAEAYIKRKEKELKTFDKNGDIYNAFVRQEQINNANAYKGEIGKIAKSYLMDFNNDKTTFLDTPLFIATKSLDDKYDRTAKALVGKLASFNIAKIEENEFVNRMYRRGRGEGRGDGMAIAYY